VDGESAENHGGNRVRHIAPGFADRRLVLNGACGEGVIADDMGRVTENVSSGSSGRLVLEGMDLEPPGELWKTAVKLRKAVFRVEKDRGEERWIL